MQPKLSYFICTTARSGSTMLSTTLSQTTIAGYPQEYFIPGRREEFIRFENLKVRDYRDYVRAVIRRATTPNGVFGSNLHASQTRHFLRYLGYSEGRKFTSLKQGIDAVFPDPRYIFIRRNNKVAQGVSYYRATLTGEWKLFTDKLANMKADEEIKFSQYGIKKSVQTLERSDAYWERFFAEHKISPLRIIYEDFIADYEGTIRKVLAYLGLPATIDIPPPVTKQQANARSKQWAKEFLRLEEIDPITVTPQVRFFAPP